MKDTRIKMRYRAPNKSIYDFYNKIYIKCPKCKCKCTISTIISKKADCFDEDILFCNNCGYLKKGKVLLNALYLDLWMTTTCCGHTLWALNEEHLDYIENYVKAQLRERCQDEYGWRNQSISSRLPKWIKSAKNRKEVLKAINKLKKMIK